jgi:hypothetical protein
MDVLAASRRAPSEPRRAGSATPIAARAKYNAPSLQGQT